MKLIVNFKNRSRLRDVEILMKYIVKAARSVAPQERELLVLFQLVMNRFNPTRFDFKGGWIPWGSCIPVEIGGIDSFVVVICSLTEEVLDFLWSERKLE